MLSEKMSAIARQPEDLQVAHSTRFPKSFGVELGASSR
jgi:hypothetical protein